MFSTPLICSSSGVATVSAITVGFAPGNCALITMEGGTTSGYSEIGSMGIEMSPRKKIMMEITAAKMGRLMKKEDKFMGWSRSIYNLVVLSFPRRRESSQTQTVPEVPPARE